MHQLEQKLDELLVKKAPVQLPESARKTLADVLPWLALIGGIVSLWLAFTTFQAITTINNLGLVVGYTYAMYAPNLVGDITFLWVSIVLLAIEAILFIFAFPALRAHKKSGWNVLLWVALVNIVYNLVSNTLAYSYFNVGGLIMSLIAAVIGLYLLFQVRGHFMGAAGAPKTPAATTPTTPASTPTATPPAADADKTVEDKKQ